MIAAARFTFSAFKSSFAMYCPPLAARGRGLTHAFA
jgi:hypothetical protein